MNSSYRRWLKAASAAMAVALLAMTVSGSVRAEEEKLNVLSAEINGAPPSEMMRLYQQQLTAQAYERWKKMYEERITSDQIRAYQSSSKAFFVDRLGGFFEKTSLMPRMTGRIQKEGFAVEKIIYESMPGVFVTGALFLPDPKTYPPPWPGVLMPCGHSATGKAYEGYQRASALLALNGMAAFCFDPYDQGERHQLLDGEGKALLEGTMGHTMIGVGSILVGRNFATYEVWDMIRAIDFLQSRTDIIPEQIGCAGNSGGGTQTAYIMALDDRIKAAAPSCYLCGLYERTLKLYEPQDAEQNIFGQLAYGMDHGDYVMMGAPRPTLILTATKDFFNVEDVWTLFRYSKRLYSRMGYGQRVDLVENDGTHGFALVLREATARWMSRWLLGRPQEITEPTELSVLSDQEIQCSPQGEVMLMNGARSLYEINSDYEDKLSDLRARFMSSTDRDGLIAMVRKVAAVPAFEKYSDLKVEQNDIIQRDGYTVQKLILRPEKGVCLPGLLFVPDSNDRSTTGDLILYIAEQGKNQAALSGGLLEGYVLKGAIALALDLRGTGETAQTNHNYFKPWFGENGQDVYTAYLLGLNFVGMRAGDILSGVQALRNLAPMAEDKKIVLIAEGNVGVAALHGAACESQLFDRVEISGMIRSWSEVVHTPMTRNQLVNVIHGVLQSYDLPDLIRTLADKIRITDPVNPFSES